MRKQPKTHKDKLGKTYGFGNARAHAERISRQQIAEVTDILYPAWKNVPGGTDVSEEIGIMIDNAYRCPADDFDFILSAARRIKLMTTSATSNKNEIINTVHSFLKLCGYSK